MRHNTHGTPKLKLREKRTAGKRHSPWWPPLCSGRRREQGVGQVSVQCTGSSQWCSWQCEVVCLEGEKCIRFVYLFILSISLFLTYIFLCVFHFVYLFISGFWTIQWNVIKVFLYCFLFLICSFFAIMTIIFPTGCAATY